MMDTVTIDGTVYTVLEARTPEQCERDGHSNTARHLRANDVAVDYWLQRPRGRYVFAAEKFTDGSFSRVRQLPMKL